MSTYLFDGHPEPVVSIAFEPGGERLATADVGGRIKLWSARDGRLLKELRGYEPNDQPRLFWHPTLGLLVLRIQAPGEIWDLEHARPKEFLKIPLPGPRVPSPRGRWIAVLGHDRPIVWDVDRKKLLPLYQKGVLGLWRPLPAARPRRRVPRSLQSARDQVMAYHFTADENRLSSLSADGTIRTWELETGHCIATVHPDWSWLPIPTCDYIRFLDAGQIAVVRMGAEEVQVWSVSGRPPVRRLLVGRRIVAVAVAEAGKEFAVATDDGRIHRWISASQLPLGVIKPANREEFSAIGALIYSPTADRLAAMTGRPGTVEVYSLSSPAPRVTLWRQTYRWLSLSVQPRELKMLLCGRHSVLQWDLLPNERRLRWRSSQEKLLQASAPGGWIVTVSDKSELIVRQLSSKACLWGPVQRDPQQVLMTEDRSRLVVFTDQTLEVWCLKPEAHHLQFALSGMVFAHTAALDPGGRWLVWSQAESPTLEVGVMSLDLKSGHLSRIPVEAHAIPCAVSHPLAALPTFEGVVLWNLETQENVGLLPYEAELAARLVFDPRGRHLAVVLPESIQIWDVAGQRQVSTVWEEEPVDQLVFAASGRLLIGTVAGPCRVGSMQTGRVLCTLACFTETHGWMAWTPDGRFDGSDRCEQFLRTDNDQTIRRVPGLLHDLLAPYANGRSTADTLPQPAAS